MRSAYVLLAGDRTNEQRFNRLFLSKKEAKIGLNKLNKLQHKFYGLYECIMSEHKYQKLVKKYKRVPENMAMCLAINSASYIEMKMIIQSGRNNKSSQR